MTNDIFVRLVFLTKQKNASHVLTYKSVNWSRVRRTVWYCKRSALYGQHTVTERQRWKAQPVQETAECLRKIHHRQWTLTAEAYNTITPLSDT